MLGLSVCKLSFEGFHIDRMLRFEKLVSKIYFVGRYWFNNILLYFRRFYVIGGF